MRLLIDIGHPAHVHLFRHLATALLAKGWEVLFSVRVKGGNNELLKAFGFPFQVYGKSGKTIFSKVFSVINKNIALYRIIKRFNPSITISHSSFYLSQVSKWCCIPNITLEDTGNMEQIIPYLPFTQCVLTPDSYHRNHGSKHIRYHGFHETAYIHPDFQLKTSKTVTPSQKVILIRLVDWTASHDLGHSGLNLQILNDLIKAIGDSYQVKILSEKPLPASYIQYVLSIPPHELHDYLKGLKLYIGEGATLASECAMFGIPSIYINSRSAGVIDAQVAAGLIYHFKSGSGVYEKVFELLSDPEINQKHKTKAEQFLKNKINLTRFLTWFIETYPKSFRIMKQNPDYQYNFK